MLRIVLSSFICIITLMLTGCFANEDIKDSETNVQNFNEDSDVILPDISVEDNIIYENNDEPVKENTVFTDNNNYIFKQYKDISDLPEYFSVSDAITTDTVINEFTQALVAKDYEKIAEMCNIHTEADFSSLNYLDTTIFKAFNIREIIVSDSHKEDYRINKLYLVNFDVESTDSHIFNYGNNLKLVAVNENNTISLFANPDYFELIYSVAKYTSIPIIIESLNFGINFPEGTINSNEIDFESYIHSYFHINTSSTKDDLYSKNDIDTILSECFDITPLTYTDLLNNIDENNNIAELTADSKIYGCTVGHGLHTFYYSYNFVEPNDKAGLCIDLILYADPLCIVPSEKIRFVFDPDDLHFISAEKTHLTAFPSFISTY